MTTHPEDRNGDRPPTRGWRIALAMTLAIGVFYLLREHWSHVAGAWPYLLLLACPLMHLFHGHSHGRPHDAAHDSRADRP